MISMTGTDMKRALKQNGYALVRDVFSAEEIARMRRQVIAVLATNGRPLSGGLCNGPGEKPLPRESDLARRLLNDVRLASHCGGEFPCEIHLHADTWNNWHSDLEPPSPTAVFSGVPAWMYKVAIFLQDHPDRGGLSVIPGSHKVGYAPCAPAHIGTRAGDIVVFDLRLRHAGRIPNLAERFIETLAFGLQRGRLLSETDRQRLFRLFRKLEQSLQQAAAAERLAIFLNYAPLHEINRRYVALRASDSWLDPVEDIRLAEALGFEKPLSIRRLIKRRTNELERYGTLWRGRSGYWLNQSQTLLLCSMVKTSRDSSIIGSPLPRLMPHDA